jgi:hypothetical protein
VSTETQKAEVIAFRDASEFETWLEAHADLQVGVWLKIAKKASGVPSLTDDEAVDIGLCFGWISGLRRSLDDVYYLQKYVPRRPRSRWSKVQCGQGRGPDRGRPDATFRTRGGGGRQGRRQVGRRLQLSRPSRSPRPDALISSDSVPA